MSATTSHPVADAIRERARILETQRANVSRMDELKTVIDTELQGEKREFSDMAWLAGFDAATAHHADALAREKAEGVAFARECGESIARHEMERDAWRALVAGANAATEASQAGWRGALDSLKALGAANAEHPGPRSAVGLIRNEPVVSPVVHITITEGA